MLSAVAAAIAGLDGQKLLELLKDSVFSAANVIPENVRFYVKNLKKAPAVSRCSVLFTRCLSKC